MSFYRTLVAALAALVIAAPAVASTTSTESTTSSTTATTTEGTTTKLNINTATAKELMQVKGLNAAKARAIVSYRKKHGEFKTTDELANVRGFKRMNQDTLKSIQDQLTTG